jgi:hypothetical protein
MDGIAGRSEALVRDIKRFGISRDGMPDEPALD